MAKAKHELLFGLSTVSEYGIREVIAEPLYLTPEGLRNCSMFYDLDPSTHLCGFRVRAYIDRASGIYGQRYEYHGSLNLAHAEAAVKVLRKVERGMDKLRDQFGYPQGFGGYLTHVATTLGIQRYALRPADDNQHRWDDGELRRIVKANSLDNWFADVERLYGRTGDRLTV